MKNFALIGAAGYIAPRHMQAIRDTNNRLLAAYDTNDSVGIIDSFFPEADFFTEFERFDRHVHKLSRLGDSKKINYVAIATPNYLHDSHIRFALRSGAHAICEKPLVLNPWNIDGIEALERETGHEVYAILQLRLHQAITSLKKKIEISDSQKKFDLDLTYVTSRGSWYFQSWKGDIDKSGGLATNIGIHFFDMLHFLFGDIQQNVVHHTSEKRTAGYMEYEMARVRWFLSVDVEDVPDEIRALGRRTYRSIVIDGHEIEFSDGFTDLHTLTYREILCGRGFKLRDARSAIETVSSIREAKVRAPTGDYHPFLKRILK